MNNVPHTAAPPVDDRAVLRLVSADEQATVATVPGTDYALRFAPSPDPSSLVESIGRRVTGRIEGRALRLHRASAGGRFIEPADGHPRIVQGTVAAIDGVANRVLLRAVVPMWLTVHEGQSATAFKVGDMLNCYVESGMAFVRCE
ncbi:MAG: hypothetical protein KDA22_14630 [Phycisphaerales bacterium]|nr:hypothetical protein [Phycisphaerales bacterium]